MADYLSDMATFERTKVRLSHFLSDLEIEANPFASRFKFYLAFEFDLLLNDYFLDSLFNFTEVTGGKQVCFYTRKPDPISYFYKHFKKFGVFELPTNCTKAEVNDIMTKDPGGNKVDAFYTGADEVCIFSQSDDWAIISSRDSEISIAGFVYENDQVLFKNMMDENIKQYIYSVQEKMAFLKEEFSGYPLAVETYNSILKNFCR
jgi:hypothetical protein